MKSIMLIVRIQRRGVKKIIFSNFEYDLIILGLAITSKAVSIDTKYHTSTGLSPVSGSIISNEIIYRTQFQERFMQKSKDKYICKSISVKQICKSTISNRRTNTLGIYTLHFFMLNWTAVFKSIIFMKKLNK